MTMKKASTSKRSTQRMAATAGSQAEKEFAPIVQALSGQQDITSARMFGSSGLKVNGKVFAMLVKSQLVVKLPQARVAALIASGAGERFNPGHGRLMKEWVAVSLDHKAKWRRLAEESRDFVSRS
jgi:TfoX/Sxy family transcriptional regulator of competence genes